MRERESLILAQAILAQVNPPLPLGALKDGPLRSLVVPSGSIGWTFPLSGGGGGLASHVRCRVAAVAPRQVCSTEPFTCRARAFVADRGAARSLSSSFYRGRPHSTTSRTPLTVTSSRSERACTLGGGREHFRVHDIAAGRHNDECQCGREWRRIKVPYLQVWWGKMHYRTTEDPPTGRTRNAACTE